MVFGLFRNKKRIDILKEEVQDSFNHVKKDINKIGEWIKHFDEKKENSRREIEKLQEDVRTLQEEIKELKGAMNVFGQTTNKQQIQYKQTEENIQTSKEKRQTNVQTSVQTDKIDRLTMMERGIVWVLINSEAKLSHEDIATLLGKDKSTIRGQINSIKQKVPELLQEMREPNGKKRLYITEDSKEYLMKRTKIKVN